MKTITQDEVIGLVQSYLDKQQPKDFRLNVEPAGIEFKHDYWYVTVLPDRNGVSAFDYSHHLTLIEEQIEENEGMNVLLVPTLVDD